MLSNVIYKYTCEDYTVSYIGNTRRHIKNRIDQHLGISSRTGRHLTTVTHSLPTQHSENVNHAISSYHFKIIGSCAYENSLTLLESLYIQKFQPNLNHHQSLAGSTLSVVCGTLTEHTHVKHEIKSNTVDMFIRHDL